MPANRWDRMCSHLRSREIRTRARSSSLTRKIGRQCRLIGDDMTERYQTNRRQNFHFEAPRLNIDPSVIFVGLVTSLHLLVILSRNGWHFLWRYWREKKQEWMNIQLLYLQDSEREKISSHETNFWQWIDTISLLSETRFHYIS